ncbi:HNH endonuclease, partial [Yersinia enterocolitica]
MAQQVIRSDVNDTLKMSLLCEVQGFCPLCRRSLVVKRGPKVVRVFDVAHIYPLNPSVADKKLLENEELLSLNIDSEDNFIALCKECHKIYDTKKTVDEYRNLVSIKKAINKMKILSQTWDKQTLHKDIAKVSEHISKLNNDDILKTELSFEALMLSEKNDNSLGVINEVKIS